MAVTNFIPNIWSARLLHNLRLMSTFYMIASKEYEGDASMGNTVKVPRLTQAVAVKDYSRTADIDNPDVLTTTMQDIGIDQEKYFNIGIEDLDKMQIRAPLLDAAVSNAAYAMSRDVDVYTMGLLRSLNNNAFGLAPAEADFDLDFTSQVKKWALQNGQPLSMLCTVVTPGIIEKIDKGKIDGTYGDNVTQEAFNMGGGDASDNAAGLYGHVNGLKLHVSQNTALDNNAGTPSQAADDYYEAYVFDPRDLALIVQVNKMEAYRPERRFMDAVKGLWNYGGKVLDASRMAKFRFNKT